MRGRPAILTALAVASTLLAAAAPPQSLPVWGVSEDDYPATALRDGLEGTTRFDVAISATGVPETCTVFKTSGHALLDRAACVVVITRGKFKPARDDAGNAVAGTWRHLAMWVLPGNRTFGKPHTGDGGFGVTVTFDAAGEVTGCKVGAVADNIPFAPDPVDRCATMGKAAVFAELLGRPTIGLANATFRSWSASRLSRARVRTDQKIRRPLAQAVFDRADDGAIGWCDVVLAPATPALGRDKHPLCGPQGFGATRDGGGQASDFFEDVVAKRAG